MTRVPEWEAAAREMGHDAAASRAPGAEPPNLSGEWADDPVPISVARDVTGLRDPEPWLVELLADAWEQGAAIFAENNEQKEAECQE